MHQSYEICNLQKRRRGKNWPIISLILNHVTDLYQRTKKVTALLRGKLFYCGVIKAKSKSSLALDSLHDIYLNTVYLCLVWIIQKERGGGFFSVGGKRLFDDYSDVKKA